MVKSAGKAEVDMVKDLVEMRYLLQKNVSFCKNLVSFVFLKHPSWNSLFYVITDEERLVRFTQAMYS